MNKPTNKRQISVLTAISLLVLAGCSSTPQVSAPAETATEIVDPYQKLLDAPNQFSRSGSELTNKQKRNLRGLLEMAQNEQWEKVSQSLETMLQRPVSSSDIYVIAGDLVRRQSHQTETEQLLEQAIRHYQKAIEQQPSDYRAHNRIAGVYRQQGKFELALEHYQRALDSWPGFALAYRNRGILHDLYLGNKAEALEDYKTFQGLEALTEGKADRQVKGWIMDLSRQLDSQIAKAGGNHAH